MLSAASGRGSPDSEPSNLHMQLAAIPSPKHTEIRGLRPMSISPRYSAANESRRFLSRAKRRVLRAVGSDSKIFGIGHGRTGTHSLVSALETLGYRMMHKATDIDYAKLEQCDGGADHAFAARYVELDQKYPRSKFIYTDRSLESWLESCRRKIPEKLPCAVGTPKYEMRVRMFGYDQGLGYKEELLTGAFIRHRNQVMHYFKDRPTDFLVINIIDGEGWEKLCPFLRLPIPGVKFPHHRPRKLRA